ncbi:LysR substrate-binding domain-containing protein [Streptomyces sp. NPDC101165]|uniref:LysR substrate-binding domain-containing protein n=1 Tax=Streptomyces sp. NPDC101165 TaxID=3366119 RepID=UPI0038099DFC
MALGAPGQPLQCRGHTLPPTRGDHHLGALPRRALGECAAGGAGITLVPESVALQYSRPDITCVPVPDAEPDEVLLAWEARRRSPLIAGFVTAAQAQAEAAG